MGVRGSKSKIEEQRFLECHMENWRLKMARFHRETKKKQFEGAWQTDKRSRLLTIMTPKLGAESIIDSLPGAEIKKQQHFTIACGAAYSWRATKTGKNTVPILWLASAKPIRGYTPFGNLKERYAVDARGKSAFKLLTKPVGCSLYLWCKISDHNNRAYIHRCERLCAHIEI